MGTDQFSRVCVSDFKGEGENLGDLREAKAAVYVDHLALVSVRAALRWVEVVIESHKNT